MNHLAKTLFLAFTLGYFVGSGVSVGQVWYPYAPPFVPCVPTQQCPYPGVAPSLATWTSGQIRYADALLRFSGDAVVSGAAAWIDFDPAIVPCPGPAPSLMYADVWPSDWQVVSGSLPWLWPMPAIFPEGGPPGTGSLLVGAPGALGWSFAVDVASPPQSYGVVVARIAWAVSAWPPGTTALVQLHVLLNLIHERDGSGWAFVTWSGDIVF